MALSPTSIQERRQGGPLSVSATSPRTQLGLSDLKGFPLWRSQRFEISGMPSPMIKAELESRHAQHLAWLSHFWRKTILICLGIAACLFLLLRLDPLCPWLHQIVHSESIRLPDAAGPVEFLDGHGRQRWTVYIPHETNGILQSSKYRSIYHASKQVSSRISASPGGYLAPSRIHHRKFINKCDEDLSFMDPMEAHQLGILPNTDAGPEATDLERTPKNATVCASSLTFVLGARDVAFGKSLLALWLAYGVAKEEGRAFFLEDAMWPYGRFTSFFKPVSTPDCQRPTNRYILPYPHSARHLINSPSAWPSTLGQDHLQRRRSSHWRFTQQRDQIFDLIKEGQQDLFRLRQDEQQIVNQRLSEIQQRAQDASGAPVVGLHVRRGDLHPLESMYCNDYLPFERYSEAAIKAVNAWGRSSPQGKDRPKAGIQHATAPILLASDDPDTIVSQDLVSPFTDLNHNVQNAQSHIILGSQRTLKTDRTEAEAQSGFNKHTEETSGWEGGFFASLFNGLGRSASDSASRFADNDDDGSVEPQEGVTALKGLIGRAYLLDLAILSKSDIVVCAVSSATCRALGVMMGADKIANRQWINVDDGRAWSEDG